ncbi:RNA-guided endonuclease IscB [Sulfobacillus thermosulfidooxidans]|uniref:RNA-guided endonuclease IscB n=1 Tax=Sulfobacillus thermosulfidooxidans TaxID=28034 RepID=UPI0003022A3E|nr:RNA-guided endonuclease IscB [Sulfobacillus thermosulfidooxidans]
MFVYVLNQHGQPLMPCSPRKARVLLKQNKAKVVNRTPFTIQLLYGSSGYKQGISLGVDAGTKHVGLSATTDQRVLYEAEVLLRTDIQELLATRREFRRARRNRKTRYRPSRFNNRKRPEGWLPPSIQNKVDAHVKVIGQVAKLLPITSITVEVAQFDTQLLKHPEISGVAYQQGEQMGFWNVREYVLFRDQHTCQWCHGKSGDKVLNVHHRESRKTGGDSPDNLVTLCETCHRDIHQKGLEDRVKRKTASLRDATQMTILRWFVYNGIKAVYPNAKLTYGYITKNTRIRHGLAKSHTVDARCISGNPNASPSEHFFLIRQVRRQNRQLHKAKIIKGGVRKANKAPRYLFGYQLFDKVQYEGQECFVFGRRSNGSFDLRLLDGTKITAGVSYKKLKLIERASAMLVQIQKTR